MDQRCLIKAKDGCIITDESAISLSVGTITAVVLFVAGSALFTSLADNITQKLPPLPPVPGANP